jgi:hypothetical protein
MFGFLGHPVSEQIIESHGESQGALRLFVVRIGLMTRYNNRVEKAVFDFDNAGSDPDQQGLDANGLNTPVAYDGNTNIKLPQYGPEGGVVIPGYTFLLTLYGLDSSIQARGWRYNTGSALIPPTRKYKTLLNRGDFVYVYGVMNYTNNAGRSAASNTATGTLTLRGDQYKNADGVVVYESAITTLNFRHNGRIRSAHINENPFLTTINGKLPASLKWLLFGESAMTDINTFIEDCGNLESLITCRFSNLAPVNQLSTLSGTLRLEHMQALKEFALAQNTLLNSLLLPAGKSDWRMFYLTGLNATASAALSTTRLNEVLTSPTLRIFCVHGNGKLWAKAMVDTDFSPVLQYFWTYNNTITGDITLTTARPSVIQFRAGNNGIHSGSHLNTHPNVNITGLTACQVIDLSGCYTENLQLPVNTTITQLYLFDNKLDIATNPNLIAQINAMTSLTTLLLGRDITSALSSNQIGQNSLNGLGAVNLSGLTNLSQLSICNCKVTSLTIYNGNKLISLNASFNTGLVSIANLPAHTGLNTLTLHGCTSFSQNITNAFTALRGLYADNTAMASVDFSGKTTTSLGFSIILRNNTALTVVTLPTAENRCRISTASGDAINISGCTSLTAINNMANLNWNNTTTTSNAVTFSGCSLNVAFPFGTNNFIPSSIDVRDNGMSQANVDATINNIVVNASKWDSYVVAKTLIISGSNATPSGIYQMPAGNDPIGKSGKEQIHWLVNVKGWTVTYTP